MLRKPLRIKRQKQIEFSGANFIKPGYEFGGSQLKSNPKFKRPLSTRLPIHLTLRARRSVLRLPRTYKFVSREIERIAKKHGLRIYRFANVGNHLHILFRLGKISRWAPFIRELTGRLAQGLATFGIRIKDFWMYRPHTRILAGWGRAYRVACQYVELNRLEAQGFISRKEMPTTRDLDEFMKLVTGTS